MKIKLPEMTDNAQKPDAEKLRAEVMAIIEASMVSKDESDPRFAQATAILERGLARTTSPSWWIDRMGTNPKHVAQSLMAEGRA